MKLRSSKILVATGVVFTVLSGGAFAQGTSSGADRTPLNPVPTHKPTPSRYMKHPRPVPEMTTVDSLNAMSLNAARQGTNFVPPAPGNEHEKAAPMKQ